jgi:hypothetical protein
VLLEVPRTKRRVYRRDPDETLLTFSPSRGALQIGDDGGSIWDGLIGRALSGPLAGTALEQVPTTYGFWFGQAGLCPNTQVYK